VTQTSGTLILARYAQGAWLFRGGFQHGRYMARRRAAFPRPDRPSSRARIRATLVILIYMNNKTIVAAASTGHLGPDDFPLDRLRTKLEGIAAPAAFAKTEDRNRPHGEATPSGLTPAHANEPGVWYAGTSPQGLFRIRKDGGENLGNPPPL